MADREIWTWSAGEHARGITDLGIAYARECAENCLQTGETALVELVTPHLGIRTISSFYSSMGVGWTGSSDGSGPVRWTPFGR